MNGANSSGEHHGTIGGHQDDVIGEVTIGQQPFDREGSGSQQPILIQQQTELQPPISSQQPAEVQEPRILETNVAGSMNVEELFARGTLDRFAMYDAAAAINAVHHLKQNGFPIDEKTLRNFAAPYESANSSSEENVNGPRRRLDNQARLQQQVPDQVYPPAASNQASEILQQIHIQNQQKHQEPPSIPSQPEAGIDPTTELDNRFQ